MANFKVKSVGLVIIGICSLLNMGNKGCSKKPEAPPPRQLKKIIELGQIVSPMIQLPNGGAFDFQFVANQQIYGVLAASDMFAVREAPPIAVNPSAMMPGESLFNFNKMDMDLLSKSAADAGQYNLQAAFSQTAWCMVNLPQARIGGSINAFELIGGGGITVGFGVAGAHDITNVPEAGFYVDFAQLDLSLRAYPPLGKSLLGAVNVTSQQTKTKVAAKFNLGAFSVGPEFYYQTPLAAVTKKGLSTGITQLAALKTMAADEWYSRVLMDHDKFVSIIGGRDVNLEVGDELLIYNEEYAWSGEPCNSEYIGGVGTGDATLYGKGIVVSVGDQLSRVEITEISSTSGQMRPQVGAKVKLSKLHAQIPLPK
ncbi:MAG: hypothetical protein ACOYOK_13865 [Pseudobdellovibrionaceae bacterium]